MAGPGKYRHHAEDCIAQARATSSQFERKVLLQIAEQYRRLANFKEKRKDRRETPPIVGAADGPPVSWTAEALDSDASVMFANGGRPRDGSR